MKITLQKVDEETTYIRKNETITFEVGKDKKKVRVYTSYSDDEFNGYDFEEQIDEEDKEKLTEEEWEFFQNYYNDLMGSDIKVGEKVTEEYED